MKVHDHDLVLFDLDGTLSDPLSGISRSINYSLTHFGYPALDPSECSAYIGPPLDLTFKAITGSSSQAHLEALVAKYRERYADIGYSENTLYPGIPDALALLKEAGISLAVCTSKRKDFAVRILEMFGLHAHFSFVDGADIGRHKWQQIEALLARGVVSPATIMVGDRSVDLVAAHRNGLQSAGVLWGYGSRKELDAERPRHMFDSPLQLATLIGDKSSGAHNPPRSANDEHNV